MSDIARSMPLLQCGYDFRRPCWMRGTCLAASQLRRQPRHRQSRHRTAPLRAVPDVEAVVGELPIREVIHDLLAALDTSSSAVLQAPPGAGKTTAVPLALLAHDPAWLRGQRVLVLEPRRVAAKAAARRMAVLLGEPVGATAGYRVRLESRISASTRVEVLTEGVLLRRLQADPALEGVGALLLDEFHERSLDADTALALALDAQAALRPDLRLVVMSATLGGGLAEDVAELMARHCSSSSSAAAAASAPIITSQGRSHPVSIKYLGKPFLQKRGELEAAAAAAVVRALSLPAAGDGDVLCILPGVGEVRRVTALLSNESALAQRRIAVQQLHGSLPPQQQDEVIRPPSSRRHQRRVIVSTPIAESSITIDGVTAVVDAGLVRCPEYNAATGLTRLITQRISVDSAEQRAGRAGRTQPGVCLRLWSEEDHTQLLPCTPPEILGADLTPLALQLAGWGCLADGGGSLPWLDPPPPDALADARTLLEDLGAVDTSGAVTPTGRRMAAVPAHPRCAHMVLRAQQLGAAELGCVLATLLDERDLFRGAAGGGGAADSSDVAARVRAVLGQGDVPQGYDAAGGRRVLLGAQQALRQLLAVGRATEQEDEEDRQQQAKQLDGDRALDESLGEADDSADDDEDDTVNAYDSNNSNAAAAATADKATGTSSPGAFIAAAAAQLVRPGVLGALVGSAYPDRIAQLRPGGSGGRPSYELSSGRVVTVSSTDDALVGSRYIAVAELLPGRDGRNDRVTLGAALSSEAIEAHLQDEIQERVVVFWAPSSKSVLAKSQRRLGSLILSERPATVDDATALPVLFKALRDGQFASLPLPAALEAWRARVVWLRSAQIAACGESELPDLSTSTLMATLDSWLPPHAAGIRSRAQLQRLPWKDILQNQVGWRGMQAVDEDAPSHLLLPTGTSVPVCYDGEAPSAAVRLQEVFGLQQTPLLGGAARVRLVLQLLSPAGRPLQVTSDLASFWASSYEAVKKEMRGRYPKHAWPDDPLATAPTRLTKKAAAAAAAAAAPATASKQGGGDMTPAGKGGGGKKSPGSSSGLNQPPELKLTNKSGKKRR